MSSTADAMRALLGVGDLSKLSNNDLEKAYWEVGGNPGPKGDKGDKGDDGLNLGGYAATAAAAAATSRAQSLVERIRPTTDGRVRTTLVDGTMAQAPILSGGTAADDPTRGFEAASSLRCTTSAAATFGAIYDPVKPSPAADPLPFGKASVVRALIWVDDPSKISSFQVRIFARSDLASPWNRAHTVSNHPTLNHGWNLMSWKASSGVTTDWGQAYRVQLLAITTAATSFNVQSVWVEATPKAGLLFVEDRGYKTFVDSGLPDLRARDIPVTWALDPALHGTAVGTKGEVITDAQVAQFYATGDDISIHAYDGAATSTMTPEQIRVDTFRSHKWLADRGYTRGHQWRAAWTQNNAPNAWAAKPYYAAQATWNGLSGDEAWPFVDADNVPRVNLQGSSTATLDGFFATLQRTHGLMICYTHGIHADGGSDMTPALWDYFIGKIDEGLGGDWLEGTSFSRLLAKSGGVLRS